MQAETADSHRLHTAIYVHIPFCSAVCPYCDFAVVAGRDHLAKRYVEAVVAEVEMSEAIGNVTSIYFGGGTPSHIDPALLGVILEALRSRHHIAGAAEITLEANPEDFAAPGAAAMTALGFNRVSFGAQSFDRGALQALGRRHSPDQIRAAVEAARVAGFDNLSLDLIYGSPGERIESWETTVSSALALEPDHVSCYALTVEAGTPLGKAVARGAPGPDPDIQAGLFVIAHDLLEKAGLERYEVSNWSRRGMQCVYNLTVWAQGRYEAYGNGAHRFIGNSRSRNIRHLDKYLEAVEAGRRPIAGVESIEGWSEEVDRLFVGLRRTVGVRPGPGTEVFLASADGRRLLQHGVVAVDGGRLLVRRPLLTDEVHRAVLGLEAPGKAAVGDNV